MASADEYAKWIVDNQDKQGTPDFDTVAQAYQEAKSQKAPGFTERLGKEWESLKQNPVQGTVDLVTKGLIAPIAGLPGDLISNMRGPDPVAMMKQAQAARTAGTPEYAAAQNDQRSLYEKIAPTFMGGVQSPFEQQQMTEMANRAGGTEWMKRQAENAGITSDVNRPILETAASLAPFAPALTRGAAGFGRGLIQGERAGGLQTVGQKYSLPQQAELANLGVTAQRQPYLRPEGVELYKAGQIDRPTLISQYSVPYTEAFNPAQRGMAALGGGRVPVEGRLPEALGQRVREAITTSPPNIDPLSLVSAAKGNAGGLLRTAYNVGMYAPRVAGNLAKTIPDVINAGIQPRIPGGITQSLKTDQFIASNPALTPQGRATMTADQMAQRAATPMPNRPAAVGPNRPAPTMDPKAMAQYIAIQKLLESQRRQQGQ